MLVVTYFPERCITGGIFKLYTWRGNKCCALISLESKYNRQSFAAATLSFTRLGDHQATDSDRYSLIIRILFTGNTSSSEVFGYMSALVKKFRPFITPPARRAWRSYKFAWFLFLTHGYSVGVSVSHRYHSISISAFFCVLIASSLLCAPGGNRLDQSRPV